MQAEDLTGRVFERLKVIAQAENGASGHARWLCHCACGKDAIVFATGLKSGGTRSCGCLLTNKISSTAARREGEPPRNIGRGMR